MSNYTKSTNFATKDNLTPGDPLKVVRGTEIDTEFNNIATAVATKTDNSAAAITGGAIDGATVGATTPATGSFTTLAASGTTTLAGALVGAVTQAAFNTVSTTLNVGGAATAVNLGAATGTATVNNTTLAAKAITASTTLAVTGTSTLTGAVTATAGVTGPITSSSVSITGGSITGITDLAVADGGTGASTAAGGLNNLLPSQTGNANKYLQTDGTNASWDAVTLSTADITGTLAVANGGTGVTSSTGTVAVVLSNSPTLVTPALGTPSAAVLTNATGLPISTGVSGLGTGVATFLGTPSSANLISAVTDETGTGSLVFATSPTLITPALGTPSALVGTNITGTASGLTAGNVTTNANLTGAVTSVGNATSLGSFSSANLLGALTDETGTGSAVFATSPTLVTPTLGVATATSLQGIIGNVTPAAGAFTTVTASTAIGTASGGTGLGGATPFTSSGVVYASSTSALATGSALTFDGNNFGGSVNVLVSDNKAIGFGFNAYWLGNSANGFLAGYINGSEGLRLTSTGLLVGTTSAGDGKVRISANANAFNILKLDDTGATGGNYIQFLNSSGSNAGTINHVSSTAVLYNTTSDYRLKNVTNSVTGQGARIDALKPIDYQWKEGGQQARGFLAHQFQEVYASSVTGTKDAVDADGNPVYQGMQASSAEVIADLVAEIQSLRQRLSAANL